MQKRCPNCFNELGPRVKKCSACGQILSEIKNDGFLSVGTLVNDRYYIGKIFKNEAACTVYSAYDVKTDSKVFVREFTGECFLNGEFKPTAPRPRLIERFLNYGKSLASVSLCKLFPRTVELCEWQNNAYAVYSFFEGESLKNLLDNGIKISKGNIIKIAKTLCDELTILHHAHMIYGAISPETIYISSDGSIHVFGLGSPFYEFITDLDDRAKVLDAEFCAPETFLNNQSRGTYSDVYSVAAIVYFSLLKTPLPISFLRSKGETIKIPHKVSDGIEKTLSTALLNALNWQAPARTKTLNAFYKELVSVKVNRKISPMILLADALGIFWYCYGKVKAFALKVADKLKNVFLNIKSKADIKNKKVNKRFLWLWITIPVVLLAVLLAFILFGGDKQKSVLNPNKNSSQSGEDGWFYGSGDNETDNSSKKSFLDLFGIESKTSSQTTSAISSKTESITSSSDETSSKPFASSSSDGQSVSTSLNQATSSSSEKQDSKPVDYSFSLTTMPVVDEMDFNVSSKKTLLIEYQAESNGVFKLLAYDDSSEGATLLADVKDKDGKMLAKSVKLGDNGGAEINIKAELITVEIYAKNPPSDMKEISLSWVFADNSKDVCRLALGAPSAIRVRSGEATFTFKLDEASLVSVSSVEACNYESDCNFYIKNSSGNKITDSIMIHGTEWMSRKVFLPEGDYTLVVTGLNSVAVCSVRVEKTYQDIILSDNTVSELPTVFGFTTENKGERKVNFVADGVSKLTIKPDGINTYYDSEHIAEIEIFDSEGNSVITETCEGITNIDVSKLNGECTLVVTAEPSCVVEVSVVK